MLYSHLQHHNDTIIKQTQVQRRKKKGRRNEGSRKTSLSIILPLIFICKFQKGCSKFACERELETEHYWNILTPKLWPSAFCLSRSPWLLNRSTGFPYYISSTTSNILACLHWLVELNSSALYYLQTSTHWYGHASTTTSDIWGPGCVTSAFFGMACVIVIERK